MGEYAEMTYQASFVRHAANTWVKEMDIRNDVLVVITKSLKLKLKMNKNKPTALTVDSGF